MSGRTDTERLDWLQTKGALGHRWQCRESSTGRGYRLLTTTRIPCFTQVRDAIDAAMDAELRAAAPSLPEPRPDGR